MHNHVREDALSPDQIFNAFEAGDIGEVEFFELALEAGCDLETISRALQDARADLDDE